MHFCSYTHLFYAFYIFLYAITFFSCFSYSYYPMPSSRCVTHHKISNKFKPFFNSLAFFINLYFNWIIFNYFFCNIIHYFFHILVIYCHRLCLNLMLILNFSFKFSNIFCPISFFALIFHNHNSLTPFIFFISPLITISRFFIPFAPCAHTA